MGAPPHYAHGLETVNVQELTRVAAVGYGSGSNGVMVTVVPGVRK